MWMGFIWLRVIPVVSLCKHSNKPSSFMKDEECVYQLFNPRAIVQLGGLGQLRNAITSSGIKLTAYQTLIYSSHFTSPTSGAELPRHLIVIVSSWAATSVWSRSAICQMPSVPP
jgi:hypothetical protein